MAEELPRSQEWRPEHLRLAVAAAGAALWAWNVDTDALSMDEHGFDLWGWTGRRTSPLANFPNIFTRPIAIEFVQPSPLPGP